MTPKPARALAWLTFAVGIVVSVLGNIGHAASDGMQPGEWAGAAFWPVALLLSVEILVRVRWQPEKRWTVARFTGLVVVSIVAAILSYLHLRSLLIVWQYGAFQATIGPLAVDGLMLIAASALLSISKERLVQPDAAQVLVSAPEQVPLSVTAPAVAVDGNPALSNGQHNATVKVPETPDEKITELLDTITKPKPRKVETSKNIPSSATEEAAFQIWMNAPHGNKPSVRKLAGMTGLSPSKAHRLIGGWKQLEPSR